MFFQAYFNYSKKNKDFSYQNIFETGEFKKHYFKLYQKNSLNNHLENTLDKVKKTLKNHKIDYLVYN